MSILASMAWPLCDRLQVFKELCPGRAALLVQGSKSPGHACRMLQHCADVAMPKRVVKRVVTRVVARVVTHEPLSHIRKLPGH